MFGPIAVDKNQHLYANRNIVDYEAEMDYYGIDKRVDGSWSLLGQKQAAYGYVPYNNFFMAFYNPPQVITIDYLGNVYVAGAFTTNIRDTTYPNAAQLARVVKWDGIKWATLVDGQENLGTILDLAADKSGNIYAASNAAIKKYVAVWNGSVWSELGTGSNALNANGDIVTLTVDKNGNVYAAGDFTNADGKRYVAKWDGTKWSELGTGTDALAANDIIYDVSTDDADNVYAAGNFTNVLGNRYVAKYSTDETLSVQNKSSNQVVSFYPNPSTGFSHIHVVEDVELTLYSPLGKPLKTIYIPSGTSVVDLNFLAEGIYTLVCRGAANTTYAPIKFIKE